MYIPVLWGFVCSPKNTIHCYNPLSPKDTLISSIMSSNVLLLQSIDELAVVKIYLQTDSSCEVGSEVSTDLRSLSTFIHFINHNFFCEVLQFIKGVIAYSELYESSLLRTDSAFSDQDIKKTWLLWRRIVNTYIMPNSEKEINILGNVRQLLLTHEDRPRPPPPHVLQV
jgi:hypothetical protein